MTIPLLLAAELTAETTRWWWVALGAGLIVAVVLVVLLHLLLRRVQEVESGAESIWHHGKQVARNTATAWMVRQTADSLQRIEEEAAHHDPALGNGRH